MSNNKKSSVDWLIDEIARIDKEYQIGSFEHESAKKIAYEIAQSMHKEEIEEAWDKGDYCIDLPDGTWEQKYKSAEHYYNETFGGNK